jgi:hypothetical protein
MNRANLLLLDSKAGNRAIARDRNGNVNNASAKDKVDNRAVAANRVAEVSKADDNLVVWINAAAGGDSRRFLCPRIYWTIRSLSHTLV